MLGSQKHPKKAGVVSEELFDLTMCLQWPENAQKKRSPRLRKKSPPALKHNSRRFDKNPGYVYLAKHQKGPIENSGTLSTCSFPEEVVEEILSRLPVKSLMRFSCVCKSWYHLIYCERFASLHINNYKISHLLVGTCGDLCAKGLASFLPTPPLAGVYCDNDSAASPKLVELCLPLLAGSCNGVLCLYTSRADNIVLWNPATKNRKIVPKSNVPRKLGKYVGCTVGFGFDPKTNDYKVLQMVYDTPYPTPPVTQLELYSLRKNSWRKVDSHDFFFRPDMWSRDLICNLPFTDYRVTCVLVLGISRPTKWEIFLFDMSTEMIDTISIPSSIEAELSGDNRCSKLFPFKESLALGISRPGFGRQKLFDIWVLNDFYSRESRSWSNIFSVEHGIRPTPKIIGSWENHILFQNIVSNKLGRFDLGNQEFTESVSWSGGCVTTTIYRESLVRVGKMNEIMEGKRSRKEGKGLCKEGKRSRK